MGNFNGVLCVKRKQMGLMKNQALTDYEGIQTVEVENQCNFLRNSDLCICVVTWNMNGQASYEDLVKLIGNNRKFDLLVVGLQEVPRKTIAQLLQTALVETHVLFAEATMQSLQLYMFGLKNSESLIRELKVDQYSAGGFGGFIRRKKGAVAIRIDYKGIIMVYISCHLSAHARNVEERNSQCRHISRKIFSNNVNPYSRGAQITVWLGDLNYRINGITTHPTRNLIQNDLHHKLLTSKDQLLQEAKRGQIFDGYCEGSLTFKPTFKYNVGSSNYDTSHKVRVPSWTDRILFKIEDPDKINASLHCYKSIDDIYSSDHKPVKAHLCLTVNKESSPTGQKLLL
ncbi:type IV inositol polyphosphate 5-phosphatase 11 [Mangifera indica]|uniref:type IV inositol polyphosphate 5-phosphatase 11 n=1 Tax=Mangifera indica TaxID=29780 RepID=UPI001CFC23FC|nr:type IV inositol polyphosphate 5-phosphatase 11 [Mangifera indica]